MRQQSFFNWSGGKDSALALYKTLQSNEFEVKYLLTTLSAEHDRVSMHGFRETLLEEQAQSIGIKLIKLSLPDHPSLESYEKAMLSTMEPLRGLGITHSIFGDIFLEDLRRYRERQLAKVNLQAEFPIWKQNTDTLVREFVDLGFKAIVICVNDKYLDRSFAGRVIDESFINDLPSGVDPCGENGEYHTFVFDGPIFKKPIQVQKGELVYKPYKSESDEEMNTGFWYCDLVQK